MHYYLASIVFSVCYLFVHSQTQTTTTVHPVVLNATVVVIVPNSTVAETTFVPTTEHFITTHTTVSPTKLTELSSVASGTDVEPPRTLHGYCIRTTFLCSKIRPCCKGPCDMLKKRCP